MSRPLTPPTRDDVVPEERAYYDKVLARFRSPGWAAGSEAPKPDCHFGALLHSPPFAAARQDLSSLVRTAGDRDNTYSHADREFVDQVLAAYLGTNVVQRRHIPDGIAAGVRIESIDALRRGDDDALTDDERLLATYIRQVVSGTVTDQTFDAMENRLGTRGLVEFTFFVALLQFTLRLYQAFGCPDPSDDEIEELLRGFRAGTTAPADWRARIA